MHYNMHVQYDAVARVHSARVRVHTSLRFGRSLTLTFKRSIHGPSHEKHSASFGRHNVLVETREMSLAQAVVSFSAMASWVRVNCDK